MCSQKERSLTIIGLLCRIVNDVVIVEIRVKAVIRQGQLKAILVWYKVFKITRRGRRNISNEIGDEVGVIP